MDSSVLFVSCYTFLSSTQTTMFLMSSCLQYLLSLETLSIPLPIASKGNFTALFFPLCLSPTSLFQNPRTNCAICLHFPCMFSSLIVVILPALSTLFPKTCFCLLIIWFGSSNKLITIDLIFSSSFFLSL